MKNDDSFGNSAGVHVYQGYCAKYIVHCPFLFLHFAIVGKKKYYFLRLMQYLPAYKETFLQSHSIPKPIPHLS